MYKLLYVIRELWHNHKPIHKPYVAKGVTVRFVRGKFYAVLSDEDLSDMDMRALDSDKFAGRKVVQLCPNRNLFLRVSAADNLILTMRRLHIKEHREKLVYEELARIGIIFPVAQIPVARLSDGERWRVGMAQALLQKPEVLILCTPWNARHFEKDRIAILRQIAHKNGKCVVLTTHLNSAAAEADIVLGLNEGVLSFVRGKDYFCGSP